MELYQSSSNEGLLCGDWLFFREDQFPHILFFFCRVEKCIALNVIDKGLIQKANDILIIGSRGGFYQEHQGAATSGSSEGQTLAVCGNWAIFSGSAIPAHFFSAALIALIHGQLFFADDIPDAIALVIAGDAVGAFLQGFA